MIARLIWQCELQVGTRRPLDLQACACKDTFESISLAGVLGTERCTFGEDLSIESSKSGVRGVTGTSSTMEEGIQKTQLTFEGVCHLPHEGGYHMKSHRLQNPLN